MPLSPVAVHGGPCAARGCCCSLCPLAQRTHANASQYAMHALHCSIRGTRALPLPRAPPIDLRNNGGGYGNRICQAGNVQYSLVIAIVDGNVVCC